MITALLTVTLSAGLTTGCTKQEQGTAIGSVVGGALGSRFGSGSGRIAMTAVGAFAGAMIGSSIGQSMDETDRLKANRALESNRTGQASSWSNPDTGNRYTVTPTRTYESREGPCREYTTRAVIDGRSEVIHGKACRDHSGRWVASS